MSKITDENEMAAYAASIENTQPSMGTIEMKDESIQTSNPQPVIAETTVEQTVVDKSQEEKEREFALEMQRAMAESRAKREEEIKADMRSRGTGPAILPVENLPSKGLFYPIGTKIWITTAKIGDIRRWTSMNEDDITDVTEKMQDVIESCCKISFGMNTGVTARWKDLIDIDRLYILCAIHDYTYPAGTNDVQIKIDEKHSTILKKENVKFMEFPEKLMKFYNAEKRCFSFPVRNTKAFADTDGKMDIYVTSIGVADWLSDYMKACEQRQDNYDRDFISYASILIPDWRYLTSVTKYYDLMEKTQEWGTYEWSLISRIRDVLGSAAATPTLRYIDDGGTERTVPLFFRDGFKSLFRDDLDIDI